LEGKETEPIGQRIWKRRGSEATEMYRNPSPGGCVRAMGSVKKGEDLVVRGGAARQSRAPHAMARFERQCNFPHWRAFPSYLARQLYDIQKYTRNGLDPTDAARRSEFE